MSNKFRELVRKIGSGVHTGENLTRSEAAAATQMMILGEATPAQIGAFMIAHRIKRPTGAELAGMLDGYDALGPQLKPIETGDFANLTPTVFGVPYDGRSRTAPLSPLTALILASAGVPVVMHGGNVMPTKEGVPLIEIWQGLGIDWTKFSVVEVQQIFNQTGLGFIHLATHFPQAENLVTYRREIGKRPPFAIMELMWCPYQGDAHIVCGYVHPPTENMFKEAFKLREIHKFTTVKGLEGSCDLPRDRTAIIGISEPNQDFERLLLAHGDYGFSNKNYPLNSTSELIAEMRLVIEGKSSELMQSTLWNSGFYLWRCGICPDINSGLGKAESLLISGQVAEKLKEIQQIVSTDNG